MRVGFSVEIRSGIGWFDAGLHPKRKEERRKRIVKRRRLKVEDRISDF
jgi:hypothetical protein